jgi:starch synthase (maltosyl-transferring)
MPLPKSSSRPARTRIENLWPVLDCGRYPVKRSLGRPVAVWADIFRDGHEILGAEVKYRPAGARRWLRTEMEHDAADRWTAVFIPAELGRWEFTVEAWVDRAASWRRELSRKVEAGQADLSGELAEGATLLGVPSLTAEQGLADTTADRSELETGPVLEVDVDRERARVGAWYELFPRSWGGFRGVEKVLPDLAELGFDVVYLPPVHPIGHTNRKGRNNALVAAPGDPGSPWAIGSEVGGHTAVDPGLGTLEDFERLVARGAELGVEVAIDFAVNCSPDHPWLREHPEWFHRRPDGTIKYAENPPKRYQDIVNVNFDSDDWRGLWQALLDVALFWVARGVRIFRVDNPHTKPLPFWEWLIAEVRSAHPDVVFLAEAFTRPVPMAALAKAGFSQSYTYFTWKNTKAELSEYMQDLTRSPMPEFFRPNFFVNTPDILHEYLQTGGRPAFEARLVLAATLSPSYGIYSGFENVEDTPVKSGSEEYLDSEKYELKERALDGPLLPLVQQLNRARRENAALRRLDNLTLLETENDSLIAYAKREGENAVVVCVNLDPFAAQKGLVSIPAELGLPESFRVTDILSGRAFDWTAARNYVALDPGKSHVLVLESP